MIALNLILIAISTFILVIAFIVIAQEVSVWLGFGLFFITAYATYKIIGSRLTKL